MADAEDTQSARPCREDLDALYVMLTRAEAVLGGDDPHLLVERIREVYEQVCAQADPLTLRRHQHERSRLRNRRRTVGLR